MTTAASVMSVDTRFGVFDASDRDVIHLPAGLPGFEQCHDYVLVSGPAIHPFNCLQGLDDARPSFLVIDPRLVLPSYQAGLSAMDYRRLDAGERDPLLWLAIVHLGSGDHATVNLRAPIVVNPRRMVAIQLLPHESPYRHDQPLGLEAADAGLHP